LTFKSCKADLVDQKSISNENKAFERCEKRINTCTMRKKATKRYDLHYEKKTYQTKNEHLY
jgi:hypothetical protein